MSCRAGEKCEEHIKRRKALVALAIMAGVFAFLSVFSFTSDHKQVTPDTVSLGTYNAIEGKHIFQAYNCMGCHTIVGNGAYLGPDLTKVYQKAGPAWLSAFLPSAGAWPTSGAVRMALQDPVLKADAGVDTVEAYYKKYPGASERVERRGGHASLMPNLPFTKDEVGHLVAFLKYTSAMNNEGWPPKPQVDGLTFPQARPMPVAATAATAPAANPVATGASPAAADPAVLGAKISQDSGCMSCHATDQKRLVGPGWGGLYGKLETLADGSKVKADDAYLAESIHQPNAKIVAGYPAGVMPATYTAMLDADQVKAIVAYIHSLQEEKR